MCLIRVLQRNGLVPARRHSSLERLTYGSIFS
jgi:hypothetical protein